MNAVQALKAKYATMTEFQQKEMLRELGISDINLLDASSAETYCKSHNIQTDLANNSAWVKYNDAKADWDNYHAMYVKANALYLDFHDIENTAQIDYNTAVSRAVAENGGLKLTSAQDSAIRRETNYTTETINNANNAELSANLLLDKCKMAVNAQRAGLNFGMMMDFKC